MNMIHVTSSNIDSIGYEGTTLYVCFKNDWLYEYYDVPRSVYEELMAASLPGRFLANHIKNEYRYKRVR